MTDSLKHRPMEVALMPHAAKLRVAQAQMKQMPQVFIPVRHFIGHGMCTRVMFAPAGTAIIGKRHLQGQHNFLMVGSIRLIGDEGDTVLHAPEVIVSPPGTKRAAVAITDVVWATTIVTELTDPEDIERTVIDPEDLDDAPRVEQGEQS